MSDTLKVDPENAAKVRAWVETRGGVFVWESVDLGNPGASWTTPATTEDGAPYPRPTWQAANQPARHVRSLDEIEVVPKREVKRLVVNVRRRDLSLVLTDVSTRKVRAAVARAGDGAWHEFDYGTQQAVIYAPLPGVRLSQWVSPAENNSAAGQQTA